MEISPRKISQQRSLPSCSPSRPSSRNYQPRIAGATSTRELAHRVRAREPRRLSRSHRKNLRRPSSKVTRKSRGNINYARSSVSGKLDFLICANRSTVRPGRNTYAYRAYARNSHFKYCRAIGARCAANSFGGIDHRIPAWASKQHARELESIRIQAYLHVRVCSSGIKNDSYPGDFCEKSQ